MPEFYIYRPFQKYDVSITTNDQQIVDKLSHRLGDYFGTKKKKSCVPLSIGNAENGFFWVDAGKKTVVTENPLWEIDEYLFYQPCYSDSVLPLHGSAVEYNGQAYVFLAATTSGKTTLTAYLMSCGFGYLTDDCVLLEKDSLLVHPYSTPLHIREGGMEVLKKLHCLPESTLCLWEDERYLYSPRQAVDKPIPLKAIYFMERTEAENCLHPLDFQEKLSGLLKSPITPYPITPEYIRFLNMLSSYVKGNLKYCSMDFAAEQIKNETENKNEPNSRFDDHNAASAVCPEKA